MGRRNPRHEVVPHEDHGFFAPDSVTRKVWGFATTPLIGIQRATVIEELDPNLIAAVDATGDNYARLATRYARTVHYFAAVAFADSRTVSKLADVLVKIHSKAIGVEPVGGGHYDANDPDSQLWILVTGWHSVLKAYEMFGPGPLSEDEERQYWAECAVAAELQTCDPAAVPRSREEVRRYFAEWRPRLAASEAAQEMMDHLLNGVNAVLPGTGAWRVVRPVANQMMRRATLATMPRYMRRMAGIRPSPVSDALIGPALRPLFLGLHVSVTARRALLQQLSPTTLPIVEPHWYGIAPREDVVRTPQEARERYGYAPPREAHLELRERQRRRVFGEGAAPSDEGLLESEALLGRLGR